MRAFIRRLPDSLWNVTILFAVMAFFVQVAFVFARNSSESMERLLPEFVISVALLGIPLYLAWVGRQRQIVWYSLGALLVLAAFARVYFF